MHHHSSAYHLGKAVGVPIGNHRAWGVGGRRAGEVCRGGEGNALNIQLLISGTPGLKASQCVRS